MKKILGATLTAGAAMLGTTALGAGSANAETTWSFNVGLANDYIFRGIDQTSSDEGDGEAFGGADVTVDNFYAGAWVSNTGSSYDAGVEYDLYAGWKPTLGGVNLDLGAIFYGYVDGRYINYSDANSIELKAAGSIPLGAGSVGAAIYWQPDYAGDADGLDNDGFYFEVNGAYTFSNKVTLSGAVGEVYVDDYTTDSYVTGNVGLTLPVTDHLSLDGRLIMNNDDADAFAGAQYADTRVIGTVKATF
jgi:uncharacterized protein (TIGR02001 family)